MADLQRRRIRRIRGDKEPAQYEKVDTSYLPNWPDMDGTEPMVTLWTGLLLDIDITE